MKRLLVWAVEMVTFLVTAFGGFLVNIAPPEETKANTAVGAGSMLLLVLLLLISATTQVWPKRRPFWLIIAVLTFLGGGAMLTVYQKAYDEVVFAYPPEQPDERYVGGRVLTSSAAAYVRAHPTAKSGELVAAFGGLPYRERVWTNASILQERRRLRITYLVFLLAVGTAIFSLIEGILYTGGQNGANATSTENS